MTDTPATAVRRNVAKLQKAVIDGLEDVKAQDIEVFDTEHLTSLFERVIVASGTSNRQTKALAASVRDAVRAAGFEKPRIEGEDNGEWIIVDCGVAVVHIMQPSIRQYYHLEELWGEKPVKSRKDRAPRSVASGGRGLSSPVLASDTPTRAAPRKRSAKTSDAAPTARKKAPVSAKSPVGAKRVSARAGGAAQARPAVKTAPSAPKKRAVAPTSAGQARRKTGTGKA